MKKCSKITDILLFKWRAVEEKMEMIVAKIALRNTLDSKKKKNQQNFKKENFIKDNIEGKRFHKKRFCERHY